TDTDHVLTTFGRLWACGLPVDARFPWRGERRTKVSLPTYPFQQQRYWIEPGKPTPVSSENKIPDPRHVDLLKEGLSGPVWNEKPLDAPTAPAPQGKAPSTWLFFLDSAGVGEALVQRLRARGDKVV